MKTLIQFFKLLSDETRLRIMMLLLQEKLCVCELQGLLDLSQPKVSKHLAKLRDVGVVEDEKIDKFVFYKLSNLDKDQKTILNEILSHIKSYPQLANDQLKLTGKQAYLVSCVPAELKNIKGS